MDVPIVDWVDRVSLSEAVCMRTDQNQHRNSKKTRECSPRFSVFISPFDPKDNVGFVLTWRLRDGIGGLFPRMNSQEDKAGSCCGLRRMWRYHQPLPPLTPSAVCCVHHVLPLLFKCTSQLGAFCSSHTFPASCIHSWALQPKDKKVHPWCVRSYWSVRLWNSLNERAPNSMAFNLDISRIYGMQELALSLGYSSVRDKDKFQIH